MNDKVLVVGGSGEIGREVVKSLKDSQLEVVATYHSERPAIEGVNWLHLDLTNREEIDTFPDKIRACSGIIVCSGTYSVGPLLSKDGQEVTRVMDTNVLGPLRLVQKLLPTIQRNGGKVILLSSDSGIIPYEDEGLYVISKFALTGMGLVLEKELSGLGIHVITVILGITATEIAEKAYRKLGEDTLIHPEVWSRRRDELLEGKDQVAETVRRGMSPEVVGRAISKLYSTENPRRLYTLLSAEELDFLDMEIQELRLELHRNQIVT